MFRKTLNLLHLHPLLAQTMVAQLQSSLPVLNFLNSNQLPRAAFLRTSKSSHGLWFIFRYSYLIEYIDPDSSKDFANQLADMGGTSSLFGGSYDVVESEESTAPTSGDADEGESEEEDDSESSATVMSDSADTKPTGSSLSTAVVELLHFHLSMACIFS